jgi:hypothetical protein
LSFEFSESTLQVMVWILLQLEVESFGQQRTVVFPASEMQVFPFEQQKELFSHRNAFVGQVLCRAKSKLAGTAETREALSAVIMSTRNGSAGSNGSLTMPSSMMHSILLPEFKIRYI